MKHSLQLEIQAQPTDSSCGPTCLAAVYRYWGDVVDLHSVIGEIGELGSGGTLAVQLACHALTRGYDAVITTYNLQLFDPTWFRYSGADFAGFLSDKLEQQRALKLGREGIDHARLQQATESYLKFLSLGGTLRMQALDSELIRVTLTQGIPILCGLSATYLYQEAREVPLLGDPSRTSKPDDVAGEPSGHFVVLHGFDPEKRIVRIADPLHPNPFAPTSIYSAALSQVISAILLGIVTYDANLLTLSPRQKREESYQ